MCNIKKLGERGWGWGWRKPGVVNSKNQVLNWSFFWNHQELLIANYPRCDHLSLKIALDHAHISSRSSETSSSMIDKIATVLYYFSTISELARKSVWKSLLIYSMVSKPAQTCTQWKLKTCSDMQALQQFLSLINQCDVLTQLEHHGTNGYSSPLWY